LHKFDWSNTIMEKLGIEIIEFTRERVTATMPVAPGTYQPFGLLHGGVSLVLAETVASSGSYLYIDPNTQRAVGLEINGNHLKSVSSGMVKAVGIPVHTGKRTLIWDVKIYDEEENLFCVSRCTVAVVDLNPREARDS
jgi:1,4-dihydroxy-2-naphthoyl-CoA hydrolase